MKDYISNMPIQKIPLSKKTEEWRKDCLNYFIGISGFTSNNSIPDEEELQSYYDLYNGIYNEKDLKYVINPFNQDDGFPAMAQDYNIIRPKIDLLLGEETKRPFNFKVCRTSDIAASEMQDIAKNMLMQYVQAAIMSRMSPEEQERFQQALQSGEIQTPEQIQNYLTKSYKDVAEITAYHTLQYLFKKLNLSHEFLKGFKDGLCGGLEFYYVGIRNGDPFAERINPKDLKYPAEEGIEFIDESSWCVRRIRTSWSALYDDYYDRLDEKQLNKLLDIIGQKPTAGYGKDSSPMDYNHIDLNRYNTVNGYLENKVLDDIILYHVCWKSCKKIGFVTILNPETGEPEEFEVDETYKVTGNELSVEWKWILETWEGYRTGEEDDEDALYFGMQPVEYQFENSSTLNSAKLPYTGVAYSNTNSKAKSLVAVMKPLQYMYIILWYRLELAIARDKGKVPLIDVTTIPKSMGIDVDKWMHYLSALGVAFINPYECFDPNTKVLMYDGSIKAICDIKVGDTVMGADGTKRTVLATHSGIDHMYKLNVLTGGEDQIVNSKHLIYYKQKNYHLKQEFAKFATPLELLNENKEKPYYQAIRYLQRVKDVLPDWKKDLLIDPYILGVWLGDGYTNKACFVTADMEILKAISNYANKNDMYTKVYDIDSKCVEINIFKKGTNHYSNKPKNPFLEALRTYDILNNKDIPDDYIYTSTENKLQLLAGLIDTDGCYSMRDRSYTFSQCESRKKIVEKVAFIARSIGFKCTVSKYVGPKHKKILNQRLSVCEPTWVVSILDGDLVIPTKVARKKGNVKKSKGSSLQSNFKVTYHNVGKYCGITVDGDNLFLLSDFTIVHNCGWDIPGRDGGRPSQFSNYTAMDLTMGNTINTYIGLLEKIEQMVSELSGITQQRQGAISSNELVGNVERSVVQSAHITEPWFWLHNQCKKKVLSMLLDTAKYTWKDTKQYLHYILDDATRTYLQIDESFSYEDFDIFVSDSTKDSQVIEQLKSLTQPAMQNGATLLDIAEILTTDNLNMIKNKLQDIENKRLEQQQAMQEQENQQQQQLIQMQNEVKEQELALKEAELDLDKYKIDQDNATKITVAQLNAYRYQQDMDQNNNGTPDVMEIGAQEINRQKVISDAYNKQMELANKMRVEDNKKELEKRKLDAQERADKLKATIEKEKLSLEKRKLEEAKKLQRMKDQAAMEREKLKSRTALRNKTNAEAAKSKK